jgi:hypothetical protein
MPKTKKYFIVGPVVYDNRDQSIFDDFDNTKILFIRGWGRLKTFEKQYRLGQFVADAMNEALQKVSPKKVAGIEHLITYPVKFDDISYVFDANGKNPFPFIQFKKEQKKKAGFVVYAINRKLQV